MTVVAEIRKLRVETGGRAIVDGVDVRLVAGRITALVGASGSGKTTTGLALLGAYPAGARVSGEVRTVDGLVGYVPQHPGAVLNPARRAGALLHDIARVQTRAMPRAERRAAARERVLHALSLAQLPDGETLLRRYPHQLSGGQQQRLVLAQALLVGARVVVADEPTTGQDALTKRRVVDQLAEVARQGIAVLLLSHDLDVVQALADEVLVMRDGNVVESGPADRLWHAPRHPWTRELLATPPASAGPAPAEGAGPVLQVRDLTARHGGTVVLRADVLSLGAGGCLAVVGRSGSGKTTLARCLAGLHRDHDGDVLLDGVPLPRSLRARSRGQLASVQYVFQDARAAFDEHRPVVDQVARTAVRLRGVAPDRARAEALDALAGLGLTGEPVRRGPDELSGGELQRAALARAVLARPQVLVCDEITSGLDTVTRRSLLDVLAALRRTRPDMGLILITHDLDVAALATHVVVLDGGELVEQGPTREVLSRPRHPFTVSLTETSALLTARARV
ncbi:ABC transporter ATP-binding protein [Streptomyces chumphonensis]|uniref:ABC transporter ATP-binding protein n=1 Tax=Streptomyces chumphonensis TaxID=1214925 RepID=A0A927EXA8_9ACTN|nr:ATP-binding cassette domain-containing protein [Streptomyces chumphonensis]MBD3930364.1 ABC transporter ATP-binding protein [Streptomyces chumphonensis]